MFEATAYKYLSSCDYSFTMPDTTFTGAAVTPKVTIKDGTATLREGREYKVFYVNNDRVGKAMMTVIGEGDYAGSLTMTFNITELDLSSRKVKVTIPYASYTYRGRGIKPTVTVKYDGKKVDPSAYKVSFKNNTQPGTADIIVSGKSAHLDISAVGSNVTLSWKKSAQADGYEVWSATEKETGCDNYQLWWETSWVFGRNFKPEPICVLKTASGGTTGKKTGKVVNFPYDCKTYSEAGVYYKYGKDAK